MADKKSYASAIHEVYRSEPNLTHDSCQVRIGLPGWRKIADRGKHWCSTTVHFFQWVVYRSKDPFPRAVCPSLALAPGTVFDKRSSSKAPQSTKKPPRFASTPHNAIILFAHYLRQRGVIPGICLPAFVCVRNVNLTVIIIIVWLRNGCCSSTLRCNIKIWEPVDSGHRMLWHLTGCVCQEARTLLFCLAAGTWLTY